MHMRQPAAAHSFKLSNGVKSGHVLSCIWSFEVSSDDTIVPVVEN